MELGMSGFAGVAQRAAGSRSRTRLGKRPLVSFLKAAPVSILSFKVKNRFVCYE